MPELDIPLDIVKNDRCKRRLHFNKEKMWYDAPWYLLYITILTFKSDDPFVYNVQISLNQNIKNQIGIAKIFDFPMLLAKK